MKINTTVTLNEAEQELANYIAKYRFFNNRKENITNAKIGPQSNEETDLQGFSAELAFCNIFNLYPDLSVYKRTSIEDSGDAELLGLKIDVKATKYINGRLLAAPWKPGSPQIDAYALMVGVFPIFTFKGFMTFSELTKPSRMGDLGRGPTYIASQHELLEIEQLAKVFDKCVL